MAHHHLKVFTDFFQPLVDGIKRSEVRFNDRNYQVDDVLTLHEGQDELTGFQYSGRTVSARVSYISTFGLQPGFVNLSLSDVGLLIIAEPEGEVVTDITELMREYVRVADLCKHHNRTSGTRLRPCECVKVMGVVQDSTPDFFAYPQEEYEFATDIVDGKPQFKDRPTQNE